MASYTRIDGANRILGIGIVWREDEDADISYLWLGDEAYAKEDAARLAAYRAGEWHMKGCWAEALVVTAGVTQTIKSGGLWGIESDSGEEYLREIEEEERAELLCILESLGFDATAGG